MKYIVWSMALAASLACGLAGAQAQAVAPDAAVAAPSAPAAATAPAAVGGVQSQNIFQVKPDASADPKYAEQSNGERMKVQPGNNAPMWRQVGQAACAVASLTLILPLVASVRYSTRAWFSVSVRSAMADMVLRASTG